MSEKKVGAYGAKSSSDTSFRKEWSQEEWAAKAREKDAEQAEYAKEAEEALKKGKKPPRKKEILPKPSELAQARTAPLDLTKNLNKTIIVNAAAGERGQTQPGFYCEVCKRTCKDSVGYLDHINGRSHLRRLGQTTKVVKSTLNDVRLKIASLREASALAAKEKAYDFDQRIKEIKETEKAAREEAREQKRRKKEEKREEELKKGGEVDEDVMLTMGFGGFGGGRK